MPSMTAGDYMAGDFKPGDRVVVKPQYQGKTYAARAKRKGVWIVDTFLNVNWVLKRPDDWDGPASYPKRLRAKPYQIDFAPAAVTTITTPTPIVVPAITTPKPTPTSPQSTPQPQPAPVVNVSPVKTGDVVLITAGMYKSDKLHVTGTVGITYIELIPLFGNGDSAKFVVPNEITPIPQEHITITYQPK